MLRLYSWNIDWVPRMIINRTELDNGFKYNYLNYFIILIILLQFIFIFCLSHEWQLVSKLHNESLKGDNSKLSIKFAKIFDNIYEQNNELAQNITAIVNSNKSNSAKEDAITKVIRKQNNIRNQSSDVLLPFAYRNEAGDAKTETNRYKSRVIINSSAKIEILKDGSKIIPIETSIVNKKGVILGKIKSGINLNRLYNELSAVISENTEFLLVDQNYNIVARNQDFNESLSEEDKLKIDSLSSFFDDAIIINNQPFYLAKKIYNSPYTILSGYPKGYLEYELKSFLMPRALILIVSLIIIFVLFYLSVKHTRQIKVAADHVKKNMLISNNTKNAVMNLTQAIRHLQEYKR